MDIISCKGNPISFLLMNLHIVCTNKLLNGHFYETSRSNRMMAAIFKYPPTQRDCILYVRMYVYTNV